MIFSTAEDDKIKEVPQNLIDMDGVAQLLNLLMTSEGAER